MDFYKLSIPKTLQVLASQEKGLSEEQTRKILNKEGLNVLPQEKRITPWDIFSGQFKSPLIYILFIASIITFFLEDYLDAIVILVAILINVVIGFFQEYQAQNALEKLKEVISLKAIVIREGLEREIDAKDLVSGDIVVIQAGDKLPADMRIIESKHLKINEAHLTGESIPVEKTSEALSENLPLGDQKNLAFMGTEIVEGWGKGVIFATGEKTEVGRIALLISETKEEATPLQISLAHFSRNLSIFILLTCLGIFLIGILAGHSLARMFSTSVALAVSAIPEGMAVALTAILAFGMQKILKEKALVRKLLAAETLGSTTVICTDKTGTLTQGEMRVVKIFTNNEYTDAVKNISLEGPEGIKEEGLIDLMEISVLCNDAFIENPQDELNDWRIRGDSTERALILSASQAGFYKEHVEKRMPRLDVLPFDSTNKYMFTLHHYNAKNNLLFFKGAPEKMLGRCSDIRVEDKVRQLSSQDRDLIKKEIIRMGEQGLRLLGLGYKKASAKSEEIEDIEDLKSDFIWVGLLGIKDPLRPEAKETLDLCRQAGIKVAIVTGDYRLTARSIMEELGIKLHDENIIEGDQLRKLSDEELKNRIFKIHLFARVSPEDKIRIVSAFQARGEVVAMTGDGINDAPALKKANVGVVVGSGTEVAKETADVVLLDDNFKTIISAIKQGRIIYDNMRKVILYLLSDSFSEIVLILGSLLLKLPPPLTAAQILWINLVTDGFPNIALTLEPGEEEIMNEKPRNPKESILNFEMKTLILLISVFTGLANLLIFYLIWHTTGDVRLARSVAFVSLGLDSLIYVFSCRTLRHSIFKYNPLRNRYLIYAVLGGFLVQLAAVYVPFFQGVFEVLPLSWAMWQIVFTVVFIEIILIEIAKYIFIIRNAKLKGQN